MSDQEMQADQLLTTHAQSFGVTLNERQLQQFSDYQKMLLAWNERFNLTRIVEPREVIVRHFLDSLSCVQLTGDLNDRRLIDVGSGAGFPGVPLKIAFPTMQLTLVESVSKKADFLRALCAELDLSPIEVIDERAETAGRQPQHRELYDWAVARAVAQLPTLLEYLLPLVKVGGCGLAMKGESAADELKAAANAIAVLGGGDSSIHEVLLPERTLPHYLVVVAKRSATPPKYPRRPGVPQKRPL